MATEIYIHELAAHESTHSVQPIAEIPVALQRLKTLQVNLII